MSKDLQTNIAAAIAALAIIIKVVLSYFNIQIEFTQEFLSAITVIAGLFSMWMIGKPGNNPDTGGTP